jgi:hypothetical protein
MTTNVIDELQLYRGKDFEVSPHITLRQPTLEEICEYGEKTYYGTVFALTATSSDYKVQLYDMGIDYENISDYDFFVMMTRNVSTDDTKLLFGEGFDLSQYKPLYLKENDEIVLKNPNNDSVIDKITYTIIVDYLRKAHYLERHFDLAGNEYTKKWFVDHDRKMAARQKKRPFESMLLPLISAMTNTSEFKYRFDDVWTLRIYPFMDAVRRVQKIKQYNNTMHGVYAGTVDLKKINQEELNWIGKLSTSSS